MKSADGINKLYLVSKISLNCFVIQNTYSHLFDYENDKVLNLYETNDENEILNINRSFVSKSALNTLLTTV